MKRHVTTGVIVLSFLMLRSQHDTIARMNSVDSVPTFNLPVFDTGGDEAEAGASQQDISSLLQGSRDVFVQLATFQFAAAGFRMRGLPGAHHRVTVNGVDLANPESGYAAWSTWGGLNEIGRHTESSFGNTANRYGFAGPGGYTNINAQAGSFRKGTRAAYSAGNRIFTHRLSLSHSTGLTRSGWAVTTAASLRTGDEVNVPGTYFSAWSAFMSVQRRLNYRNDLTLTSFIAPVEQARANASVRELFVLTGDPDYNSAWGYQNGRVRSAKVSRQTKPTAMLTHQYKRNETTRIFTSLCFQGGRNSRTGLNYADAANPRPDYYRYLPSYYYQNGDDATGDLLTSQWQKREPLTQIRWDDLIAANRGNLYSLPSTAAIVNTTETRARYLVERQEERQSLFVLASTLQFRKRRWFISGGLSAKAWQARKYKVADDLLGATFWLDIDPFAEGDDELVKQNDIERPDRKVSEGEKFGYDYSIHIRRAEIWGQAEYTLRRWEFFIAITSGWQQVYRAGHVANGKFPEASKGRSDIKSLPASGIRSGALFKFNGRHYLSFCSNLMSSQPAASDMFISPTVRNDLVSNLSNETIAGAELTYHLRRPGLRARFTAYANSIGNQLWLRTYWHDEYNATVNMIMRNVRTDYSGLEAAIEKELGNHSLLAGASFAQALYRSRPQLEAWRDNNSEQIFTGRTVYLKNYRAGASPQLAVGGTYKFQGRRSWFVAVGCNFFDHIYTQVNPVRRTMESAGKFSDEEVQQALSVIGQERLSAWWMFNASAFKAFRLRNRTWIGASVSLMNLLNKRIPGSGFEQLRWDPANPDLFPAKYTYTVPRTILFSVTYNI